jgi:hypothetical protein
VVTEPKGRGILRAEWVTEYTDAVGVDDFDEISLIVIMEREV